MRPDGELTRKCEGWGPPYGWISNEHLPHRRTIFARVVAEIHSPENFPYQTKLLGFVTEHHLSLLLDIYRYVLLDDKIWNASHSHYATTKEKHIRKVLICVGDAVKIDLIKTISYIKEKTIDFLNISFHFLLQTLRQSHFPNQFKAERFFEVLSNCNRLIYLPMRLCVYVILKRKENFHRFPLCRTHLSDRTWNVAAGKKRVKMLFAHTHTHAEATRLHEERKSQDSGEKPLRARKLPGP